MNKTGVPFFLKQLFVLGAGVHRHDGDAGKVVSMPRLDGKIWNELPW